VDAIVLACVLGWLKYCSCATRGPEGHRGPFYALSGTGARGSLRANRAASRRARDTASVCGSPVENRLYKSGHEITATPPLTYRHPPRNGGRPSLNDMCWRSTIFASCN
jgi:hypothetical protein